jgi:hypothetical protein
MYSGRSARDVAGNPFYELRWNPNDERVRIAFQAVLVTDSVIHKGMVWLIVWRVADVVFDLPFLISSSILGKPAKSREFSVLPDLRGSSPISGCRRGRPLVRAPGEPVAAISPLSRAKRTGTGYRWTAS